MRESDTPMVDDMVSECHFGPWIEGLADLARQLERERHALRAEIDRTYNAWCGRDLMHLPLCDAIGKRIEIADRERAMLLATVETVAAHMAVETHPDVRAAVDAALRACQPAQDKAQ